MINAEFGGIPNLNSNRPRSQSDVMTNYRVLFVNNENEKEKYGHQDVLMARRAI